MAQLKGTLSSRGKLEGKLSIGSGGTNNYPDLNNLPQINGVTLIDNKSSEELGINIPTKTSDLENNSGFITSDALPTKTSDLRNDSGYVTMPDVILGIIDDVQSDNDSTYSSNKIEAIIDALLPIDEASGAIATFSTTLAKPLVSIDVDESATKVFQRGANLWSEEWELGTYNTNTGAKSSSSTRIRSKDLFPIPNAVGTNLYITPIGSGGNGLSFLFYDKNKVFKNGYYRANTAGGFSFTIQEDWHYMAISPADAYGTTYSNDISIRMDSNYNYVAYNASSNDYDIDEIENIIAFNGINNIFADSGNIDIAFKDSIQHYIDKKIAETQALIL